MNFFEQQDRARRNTRRLVILLCAAVISLIVVTTVLFAAFIGYLNRGSATTYSTQNEQGSSLIHSMLASLSWELAGGVSLVVICVVSLGSLYKFLQLRGGGKGVAEAMDGKLISLHAADLDEKKILNVVEEMAIASGTPVPPVYVIEDDAINAFAAGHTPQNAVIGITRGCIRLLSRDELQGVIAHEFSHIFHGDMRLNIRLVAMLNGILLLGLIGYFLVRSAGYGSMGRSSRDKNPAAIFAAGIALIIIGYTGTFFGNLIKAAVSRQREFLADASAVQFTRNPAGITGALKKIGGYASGSKLASVNAAEFSHMYFSQGISTAFNALMATHPPLEQRIKRIEPRWDGRFPQVDLTLNQTSSDAHQQHNVREHQAAAIAAAVVAATPLAQSIDNIGNPTESHLAYAQRTLNSISDELREAAHEPFSARALVYALLLDRNQDEQLKQWDLLHAQNSQEEILALQKIAEPVSRLNAAARLPLIELCLPALKQLSKAQYSAFKLSLDRLIQADKKISLMEWALRRIVTCHIEGHPQLTRHRSLRELRNECQVLLSMLAHAGADTEASATEAFARAAELLRFSTLPIQPKSELNITSLEDALTKLNRVKALQKPALLKAMAQCVTHDGKITTTEAELFRAIADSLDCPVPPLLV